MAANPITALVLALGDPVVASPLVQVPVPAAVSLFGGGGSLRALASGTVTVTLTNAPGDVIATLTWTAAGMATVALGATRKIPAGGRLRVNCTGAGTGAAGCVVTVWVHVQAQTDATDTTDP